MDYFDSSPTAHRRSNGLKARPLIILICIATIYYLFIYSSVSSDTPFLNDSHYLASMNQHWNHTEQLVGRRTYNKNHTHFYFHLPGDTLYELYRDFYHNKNHQNQDIFCMKAGTIPRRAEQNSSRVMRNECDCLHNYTRSDCSIPRAIIDNSINFQKIYRLEKPRKMIISLCFDWNTLQYNEHSLKHSLRFLQDFVDFFIIQEFFEHERRSTWRFVNTSRLYYSSTKLSPKDDADFIESRDREYYKNSWNVITNNIVDYHPQDMVLFMACNNLPIEEVVRLLKYNHGFEDVAHLFPIHATQVLNLLQHKSVRKSSTKVFNRKYFEIIYRRTSNYGLSTSSQNTEDVPLKHFFNSVLTFQYLLSLCKLKFDEFLLNYCQTNAHAVDAFHKYYWNISLISIGAEQFPVTRVPE